MPARFCATPGCRQLHHGPGGYCAACARTRDAARGSTAARGYGSGHRAMREQLLEQFVPGYPCSHCGRPMTDTTDLDLAHTDDRAGYRGLAHSACNRGSKPPQ